MTERPASPVLEQVPRELFTGREHKMNWLRQWTDWASRGAAHSVALVGPRRMGKTAILTRLYNELFWGQETVVPFFFEVSSRSEWLHKAARRYYMTLILQYAAFRLKEPALWQFEPNDLVENPDRRSFLEPYLDRPEWPEFRECWEDFLITERTPDPGGIWDIVIRRPARWAGRFRTPIIVMIDEFQWLNERIYWDEAQTRPMHIKWTDSFFPVAENYRAPMLVAGSAVTIMARHVLGGGMNGRFQTIHLEPLSLEEGTELALRLARYHQKPTSLEAADFLSRLAGGHPYYITAVFNSEVPDKDLTTPAGVEAAYEFEITRGRIREFWQDHFQENVKYLDGDRQVKRILFYMLRWESRLSAEEKAKGVSLRDDQIAAALGLEEEPTREVLERLCQADVIASDWGAYRGLRDETLARCLRLRFEREIEKVTQAEVEAAVVAELKARMKELETELERARGQQERKLRNLAGVAGQAMINYVMLYGFDNQTVPGHFFHADEPVFLPRLERVFPTQVQAPGSRGHQIDNYGQPREAGHAPWITEQKNWNEPVPVSEVETFLKAAAEFQEREGLTEVVRWMYARSGFAESAAARLVEEGVLFSDLEQVCALMAEMGMV